VIIAGTHGYPRMSILLSGAYTSECPLHLRPHSLTSPDHTHRVIKVMLNVPYLV
jgi:hypothetical protein